MAVHVPLSLEAQLEARVLMMSTNNVLSPANGAPIIVPSQDMVLGLYYISLQRAGMKGEMRSREELQPDEMVVPYGSVEEVEHALASGAVHLHARVQARIRQIDEDGSEVFKVFDTTPGRILLGSLLPLNAKTPFDLVNRLLRKQEVQEVIDTVYRYCGQKESVIFCDQIMAMGFREAFKAGLSFGKDDLLVPDTKSSIVAETRSQVAEFERQYWEGLITQNEKYNKVVDVWTNCTDQVADAMMSEISSVREREGGAEGGAKLGLHDVALRRSRLACPDEAACGDARPHGQALWRDHRDAHHFELQGRPERSRVLQLDPRGSQGAGRHRPEDRELGLLDAAARRCRPGLHCARE